MVIHDNRLAAIYAWLFAAIGSICLVFGTWQVLLGGTKMLGVLGLLTLALTLACRIARRRRPKARTA